MNYCKLIGKTEEPYKKLIMGLNYGYVSLIEFLRISGS